MTCSGCTNAVTRALSRVPGVANIKVDLEAERAWIFGVADSESLIAAVQKAGYGAQLAQSESGGEKGRGRDDH
jgi:copper chaperone CopZ